MPEIRRKEFDPNNNKLVMSIPKPLPALYADSDILFSKEMLEYRMSNLDHFLGARMVSGTFDFSFFIDAPNSLFQISGSIPTSEYIFKGTKFSIDSSPLNLDFPLPTPSTPIKGRTYSLWLRASRVQYHHTDKLDIAKNQISDTELQLDDNLGGVQVDDPQIGVYTVEAMDTFGYRNPDIVLYREDEIPSYDGEKVIIDTNDNKELLIRVYTFEVSEENGDFSFREYSSAEKDFLDVSGLESKNLTFIDYLAAFESKVFTEVNSSIAALDSRYGRLNAPNTWAEKNRYNKANIIGISTDFSVAAHPDPTSAPTTQFPETENGVLYNDTTREVVIYLNTSNSYIFEWTFSWAPRIVAIRTHPSNLTGSYKKESSLNFVANNMNPFTVVSPNGLEENSDLRFYPFLGTVVGSLNVPFNLDSPITKIEGVHATASRFEVRNTSNYSLERLKQDLNYLSSLVNTHTAQILDLETLDSTTSINSLNPTFTLQNFKAIKDSLGRVQWRGAFERDVSTNIPLIPVGVLPASFAPTSGSRFAVLNQATNSMTRLSVSSTGEIVIFNNPTNSQNTYFLDGISYFRD